MKIRSHRGYLAMFGEELNIFCFTFIGEDGNFIRNGLIIRDGTVEFTEDFTVVAYMGEDSVSNQGGHVDIRIDGELQRMEFVPQGKSAISITHGFPCVDGMCIVTMDDKTGVGLSETSSNAQNGSKLPLVFDSCPDVIENGVFDD